jgi:hypothetical protein
LQQVTFDTIDGNTYLKIVQAKRPIQVLYLPFFQCPLLNLATRNNYLHKKIKGIEKGKKRERAYITDKNNIRNIISKTKERN